MNKAKLKHMDYEKQTCDIKYKILGNKIFIIILKMNELIRIYKKENISCY